MAISYDPLSPTHWQDPYPVYRELRDHEPVHWAPQSEVWCISRHEDVAAVLKSPETFSSAGSFDATFLNGRAGLGWRDGFEMARFLVRTRQNPLRLWRKPPQVLITVDPPEHDVMRDLVNRGFTPRRIQAWEKRMREVTERCMAKLHSGDGFDVVRDLAIPLPLTLISDLVGIDPEGRADFKRWGDQMVALTSGSQRGASLAGFLRTMGEMSLYLRGVIAERRAAPTDDLISSLVDPRHEQTLDDQGVIGFITLLLIAGNETTTNLIGNATRALLDHPEQLERVQADASLLPGVVEETLRYDNPVQFLHRRATRDVELAGTTIPANSRVAVLLGSANRDERRFPSPDEFDPGRDTRGHLGFGFGVHFCLGASLARLEAKVALEALVPELPRLRRRNPETAFVDSFQVRGPRSLELVAAPA